ncbi:interleukin-17 receptor C [Anguilla anguilla]|uniref:interleukin-17 receptor C n=1 Tax=Anguilla anguilla TaxID=7936 RepID=UPI0015AE2DD9|nr:interleukin-17 receptor C [Anguilla anguilla]XP_035236427.1 interleukin-17 receptor C [Anguilla anguilla]XP_035236428.1 interleukin-17 receptor C [Anguilla anguilla]XP_035236429.1 interleukin-17 receptor C [Anguilla anguilla]
MEKCVPQVEGSMAHLLKLGGVLLSFSLCATAVVLQKIEYDQNPQLTCAQGLTDCRVEAEDLFGHDSDVDVSRLELKALLCCSRGSDCRPCIQIHIYLTVTALYDDQELSGYQVDEESKEREEEWGSGEHMLPSQTEASINVCYTVPSFLNECKTLKFTLPPRAMEDHKSGMWLSLVVSDKLLFGSPVFVTAKSTHENVTLPAENDVCSRALKRIVNECNVPRLLTVIDREKGVATLQLDEEDMNYSFPMGLCQIYAERGDCRYQQLNSTSKKIMIPLHSVTPCLCFQVWWIKDNALRVNSCPFVNYTEFLKNMWDNVSVSVDPVPTNGNDTVLSWTLSAPCRVEAELWLCRMEKGGAGQGCGEVEGSRLRLQDSILTDWQVNSQGHWIKGEFGNTDPHPSLCVLGKVQGMSSELGPLCPFAGSAPKGHWSLTILVSVLILCLAILGAYLLQSSLKGWVWKCFKDEDIRGAVGGGQVVLLYPPDPDQALPGLVCRLGSSLSALGFSVSLDLWSRGELSILGPVPWLHSRLDRLQRHGGKVVLILTRAALERAEEWGRWGRDRDGVCGNGKDSEEQEEFTSHCSPYADVFSASLSCVLADYLQGRAGERFVLAQFESLPPLPLGNGQPLPELFRGLPLFSLPSQSLGFLTELAVARGGPSRRRRAGGLRAASRALAVGLRGFGSSGGFRLPGFSPGSAAAGVEDLWETVPLQPCHTPPPSSPSSSPKSGNVAWV